MKFFLLHFLIFLQVTLPVFMGAYGQVLNITSSSPIEPGLEKAVYWKWFAVPSDPGTWGLPLPALPEPTPRAPLAPPTPSRQFTEYTVKRGDALAKIARHFNITLEQLKLYNHLTSNLIRIGDVLKIPSKAEAERIAPTPKIIVKSSKSKSAVSPPPLDRDILLLQVLLDREGFSGGPISIRPDIIFAKVRQLYQTSTGSSSETPALLEQARERVGEATTKYKLKREDYAFIAPPKARKLAVTPDSKKKKSPQANTASPSYEDLLTENMLAYHTPWEFVAERFHCTPALLQALNPELKSVPQIGTTLIVPNVIPFEIENAFREPIQPIPNPQSPVTAVLRDLFLLEIYKNYKLIAVMPVSMARPGLRGRGSWLIQKAIPRPRLSTRQESKVVRKYTPPPFGYRNPNPKPTPTPFKLPANQYLQAGPNNPIGIFWIDLAKTDDPTPLPYGLHGTSAPDKMRTQQSLGGIRLSNWDIARAVRLLPEGTELQWKAAEPFVSRAPAATPN
ncbi:MAG: LysM peptidoglycan-binding domain-containing protein [Chthoniobacterales bacterium]